MRSRIVWAILALVAALIVIALMSLNLAALQGPGRLKTLVSNRVGPTRPQRADQKRHGRLLVAKLKEMFDTVSPLSNGEKRRDQLLGDSERAAMILFSRQPAALIAERRARREATAK